MYPLGQVAELSGGDGGTLSSNSSDRSWRPIGSQHLTNEAKLLQVIYLDYSSESGIN